MASYSTLAEWEAAQGGGDGAEVLFDLDCAALGAADWKGEAAVTIGGKSWTLYNSSDCGAFGPDGSTGIVCTPTTGKYWHVGAAACPAMFCPLSTLDASVSDTARYTMIMQIPSWSVDQQGATGYGQLMIGWWTTGNLNRYYSAMFGPAPSNNLFAFEGYNTWYTNGSATTERSFAVDLGRGGANLCYTHTAATTDYASMTARFGMGNNGTTVGSLGSASVLLPSAAAAGAYFSGRQAAGTVIYTVSRITVIKWPT